jgi:hypothetical protein
VTRLLGVNVHPNLKRVQLEIGSLSSRFMKKAFGRLLPATKLLIYRDNIDYFGSLNALVVTERTSLILKNRYDLKNLK